jgi:hypothetical protein
MADVIHTYRGLRAPDEGTKGRGGALMEE